MGHFSTPAATLVLLSPLLLLVPHSQAQLGGILPGLGGLVNTTVTATVSVTACPLDPCQCTSNWLTAGYCQDELLAEAYGDANVGGGYADASASVDVAVIVSTSAACEPKKVPRDCSLPQNCTCEVTRRRADGSIDVSGDFHVRAQWELKEPIASSYGWLSSTLNWALGVDPVIFGDHVTRASCCKACHDINANVNFNAGVNLAANASLLKQLSVSANASVSATVQLKADLASCNYWHHVAIPGLVCSALAGSDLYNDLATLTGLPTPPASGCGYCLIYPPGLAPQCSGSFCPANSPANPDATEGRAGNYSAVGKGCAHGVNDPHFVGAQGTHFEFNGVPGSSFCLLTDSALHVNMGMVGYYDKRTVGASLVRNGVAVRTWIRQLGVMWVEQGTGRRHSLVVSARGGKSTEREGGFMGSLLLDGHSLPLLKLGESRTLSTGSTLAFKAHEKQGGGLFDVDAFELSIGGLLKMEIKLRPAHPLLQTEDDAMTHVNVRLLYFEKTDKVHGVLGQTYRPGRETRAIDYTMLAHLLHSPISADGENGSGFLDGDLSDYKSTSIESPDCKFSAFGKALAS